MGQPGTAAAPLPRSLNKRALPPSTEPGLWSADTPSASREYLLPPVLGFTPPAVSEEEEAVAIYADNCGRRVDDTTRFPSVSRALARASAREVACIGAQAYFGCLAGLWLEVSGKKDRDSKALAQQLLLYQQRLQQEVNRTCMGVDSQRPDLKALRTMVETAWKNTMKTP